MALDFQALQTEFFARGFQYLDDAGAGLTRAKRFLNDANHQINDLEPWVYLQKSTTGAAPLTIADLGRIESVVDVANLTPLAFMDRRAATDYFADLTQTGAAEWFYVTGATVLNVFPVSTATLTVRYFKVDADMSANGDVPSMPDRFRYAIVELAAAKAYRDDDNPGLAAQAEQAAGAVVDRMRVWNVLVQGGTGGGQVITGASLDW